MLAAAACTIGALVPIASGAGPAPAQPVVGKPKLDDTRVRDHPVVAPAALRTGRASRTRCSTTRRSRRGSSSCWPGHDARGEGRPDDPARDQPRSRRTEVRQYYIGSVLNGGGAGRTATSTPRRRLARARRRLLRRLDGDRHGGKVPVIWGIDAVHGNNNVFGATLFPHNIGLGAAHDPCLVSDIGAATGQAGPLDRPGLGVRADARRRARRPLGPHLRGLLARTRGSRAPTATRRCGACRAAPHGIGDDGVIATAKHFIGDGGTAAARTRASTPRPRPR